MAEKPSPIQPGSTPHPEATPVPPVPEHIAADLDIDPTQTEDPVVDKAVDDITEHEADELLAAEDADLAKAFEPVNQPHGLKAKLKSWFRAWWGNKKLRYGTFAGIAVLLILVVAIPASRYFVLNNVGIRSSASVTVTDQSTQQPLKNVDVQLANQSAKTDDNGVAKLKHLKLGSTKLVIKRRAFATVNKSVVVGWGSNPYGGMTLNPTGSQYDFVINDFMSGKPIAKAEAIASETDTFSDEKGKLVLTVDPSQATPLEVVIKAEGYRDETISLNLDDKSAHKVSMVSAAKHAFISKRSGKYDLYSIDIDGKNEKLLLAGTGNERNDLVLVEQPSADVVALSSSRDNVRNKDGYLLTSLNVIDIKTGQKNLVAQSENIQVIDWIGNRLIFVQIAAGASASNPNRQRLVSYNLDTNSQRELASSNYFNDVKSAGGVVYYAPSDGAANGFYKTNPDGSNRVNLLSKIATSVLRTSRDHFSISTRDGWYDYKIGDTALNKMAGQPANQQNRLYQDDSQRKNSLWLDSRDGKGVLLKYDTATQADSIIKTQSGLVKPFYWLNDSNVIYRIHTEQETADYIVNLNGGQPRKITNVNDTAGLGSWYYY